VALFEVTDSDSVTTTDAAAPATDYTRFASDSETVVDTTSPEVHIAMGDSLVVTDSLGPEVGVFATDTFGTVDVTGTALNYEREVADVTTATDQLTPATDYIRATDDNVTATDSIAFEYGRATSEFIAVSDYTRREMSLAIFVDDAVVTTDQTQRFHSIAVSVSDVEATADSVSPEFTLGLSDTIGVVDTVIRDVDWIRRRQDLISVEEVVSAGLEHHRSVTDALTVTDSIGAVFDEGHVPFTARLHRVDFMTATLRRTEVL
jgi:hypothetical protein